MTALDPRLHAFRPDLADARLSGQIAAAQYSEGETFEIAQAIVPVHREPRFDAVQTTQALLGEKVRVFERREGWVWAQLEADGYVGYMAENALTPELSAPTHRVCMPLTYSYPAPDHKSQPATLILMNGLVTVASIQEKYARLANGRFMIAGHLRPVRESEPDFVAVAERFRYVPYCWGGKTVLGLDCSGLVQASLQAAGISAPRDSDMQQMLGEGLSTDRLSDLSRGDLVFWNGHVGIMTSRTDLLHANGHFMQATLEPLAVAVARIAALDGPVTAVRRLRSHRP